MNNVIFPELTSIKTRRIALGLKQEELAKIAGVSQSLIAKLEKGRIDVSYSIAKKIFLTLDSLEHKKERKCSDIMTRHVSFVKSSDKIEKASEIMKRNSIDQLPVLSGRQVVGSISESLIFNKIMQGVSRKQLLVMKVSDIMTEPYPIINSEMPVSIASPMLKTADAILITEKNKLAGIITKANLI